MRSGFIIIILQVLITTSFQNIKIVPDQQIQQRLKILQNQSDSFLVDSISPLDWDELYILKPYLSDVQYERLQSKISYLPSTGLATFSANWFTHLVFAKNGRAIEFLEMETYPCDLTYVGLNQNPALIKKGEFLYVKKKTDGRILIYDKYHNDASY